MATVLIDHGDEIGGVAPAEESEWKRLATDVSSADLSNVEWEEADVIMRYLSGGTYYSLTYRIEKNTPSGYYYDGSNAGGMVGGVIDWNNSTQVVTASSMWFSGNAVTGTLVVNYR